MKGEPIAGLLLSIYAASLDSAEWTPALDALCAAFGAQGAQLYTIDTQSAHTVSHLTSGLPDSFSKEYVDWFSAFSERNRRMLASPLLPVATDYMFQTEAEMDRSPHYDWRRRYDLRYAIGSPLIVRQGRMSILALHRSKRAGHVQAREVELYALVKPHICRALDVGMRLQQAIGLHDTGWAALEAAEYGVVALSDKGAVLAANREARRIGADACGLSLTPKGLIPWRPIDRASFERALVDALTGALGSQLAIAKRGSARPYAVSVLPAPRRQPQHLGAELPAVLVTLTDPDRRPEAPKTAMRRIYGFTRAETRVAVALVEGSNLAMTADRLRLAQATVRRHLASIFLKTHTHRQSELIRLLSQLPRDS